MSDQNILAGCITPHPPVIVPGVERRHMKAKQTVAAMEQLSAEIAALEPDTLVVISPHAPMFSDYLFLYDTSPLVGDLSAFGAPEVRLSMELDRPLLSRFLDRCTRMNVHAGGLTESQLRRFGISRGLDHGAFVPLYFLQKARPCPVLIMSSPAFPMPVLYEIGYQIHLAAADEGRRIVIVASGDQSHKANEESPYGCCKEGALYDQQLVTALNNSDRVAILSIDPQIRQKAAECGYRSIVMLCGAFKNQAIQSSVLSYEAPYGIGYCVAKMLPDPAGEKPKIDPLEEAMNKRRETVSRKMKTASAPVQIARETLENYLQRGRRPTLEDFKSLIDQEPWLLEKAGVFVTLYKDGELRGCIGTTASTTDCIAAEIIQNAISAAMRDPRFEPVTPEELPDLTISVDVLEKPVPISSIQELDPKKYGVIVRSGHRSGLLLPDLEGIDTVEEQLSIAKRKAGIQPDEPCRIERFCVRRYT